MKYVLSILILITFLVQGFAQSSLPNFYLKTTEGKNVQVQDLGKDIPVILIFWATWCNPCLKELDAFDDLYDEWQQDTKVEIVAVSIDDSRTVSKVNTLVNGKGWEYKVLLDTNHQLKRAMYVNNLPHLFIIKKGKIIYQHKGYTPGSEVDIFEKLSSE